MNLRKLSSETLEALWQRIQGKKYKHGVNGDIAYRGNRMQYRIGREQWIREFYISIGKERP